MYISILIVHFQKKTYFKSPSMSFLLQQNKKVSKSCMKLHCHLHFAPNALGYVGMMLVICLDCFAELGRIIRNAFGLSNIKLYQK